MLELDHQGDHGVYRLDLAVGLAVQQSSQEPGLLLEHAVLEVALNVLLTGVRILLFSDRCKNIKDGSLQRKLGKFVTEKIRMKFQKPGIVSSVF